MNNKVIVKRLALKIVWKHSATALLQLKPPSTLILMIMLNGVVYI